MSEMPAGVYGAGPIHSPANRLPPSAIRAGEELTVYYSFDTNQDPQECHCGARACRGDMRRAKTMFIGLAFERLNAHVHTAENAWSLLKRKDAK